MGITQLNIEKIVEGSVESFPNEVINQAETLKKAFVLPSRKITSGVNAAILEIESSLNSKVNKTDIAQELLNDENKVASAAMLYKESDRTLKKDDITQSLIEDAEAAKVKVTSAALINELNARLVEVETRLKNSMNYSVFVQELTRDIKRAGLKFTFGSLGSVPGLIEVNAHGRYSSANRETTVIKKLFNGFRRYGEYTYIGGDSIDVTDQNWNDVKYHALRISNLINSDGKITFYVEAPTGDNSNTEFNVVISARNLGTSYGEMKKIMDSLTWELYDAEKNSQNLPEPSYKLDNA